MKGIVTLLAIFLALPGFAREVSAQEFQLIVHESSSVSQLTRDEVSKIFRKKMQRVSSEVVVPVDLKSDQVVREAFSQGVHGRSANAIESYWLQQVFAGKDNPPEQLGAEADVLDFVRSTPGAIGYVGADVALGQGIKAVPITN